MDGRILGPLAGSVLYRREAREFYNCLAKQSGLPKPSPSLESNVRYTHEVVPLYTALVALRNQGRLQRRERELAYVLLALIRLYDSLFDDSQPTIVEQHIAELEELLFTDSTIIPTDITLRWLEFLRDKLQTMVEYDAHDFRSLEALVHLRQLASLCQKEGFDEEAITKYWRTSLAHRCLSPYFHDQWGMTTKIIPMSIFSHPLQMPENSWLEGIRSIGESKGAASTLFISAAFGFRTTLDQLRALCALGAFGQHLDDFIDIDEDNLRGLMTYMQDIPTPVLALRDFYFQLRHELCQSFGRLRSKKLLKLMRLGILYATIRRGAN
jgi:hypothetical protein